MSPDVPPRRLRRIAFVVVASLGLAVVAAAPAAATSTDKRREVEAIADELERLELQIDVLAEDYMVAVDDKRRLDEEIVESTERIGRLEERISRLQGDLSRLAVQAFVSGGSGGMLSELLAPGGGGPNDAVQMQHFTEIALNAGTETTDDLDALLDDLETEQATLEAQQRQAEALTEQIAAAQEAAQDAQAEYQQNYAEAQAELGQLLVEEEERRQAEAAREAQEVLARAQAEAAASAASSGGTSSGGSSSGGSSSGGSTSGGGSSDDSSSGGDTGGSTGGEPSPSAPPVSSRAGIAVAAARSQLGVPYRFAAEIPGVAFDCSGLTKYAWGQAGVYLPHQSRAQFASTPRVSIAAAQPGDLIYYYSPISHVGIYVGGGQMIHAPATGQVVSYTTVNWAKVTGVTRPG